MRTNTKFFIQRPVLPRFDSFTPAHSPPASAVWPSPRRPPSRPCSTS